MSDDEYPGVVDTVRPAKLPGRKAGELRVDVTRGGSESARFELRIDVAKGDWIAVADDMIYRSPDKAELERYLKDMVRRQRRITWTRYLVIDYEAEGPGEFGARPRYEPGAPRDGRGRSGYLIRHGIAGIRLDWKVIDISDPIQHPGQSKPRRKMREVTGERINPDPNAPKSDEYDDSYRNDGWERVDKLSVDRVLYTPERHQLLLEIRRAFGEIDAKLSAMFYAEDTEQLGTKLDLRIMAGLANVLPPGDADR
jgi:hypothetical protein